MKVHSGKTRKSTGTGAVTAREGCQMEPVGSSSWALQPASPVHVLRGEGHKHFRHTVQRGQAVKYSQ